MSKKKVRSWKDLSEKEQADAKSRFMEYDNIKDIAKDLNVPRTTLNYHANTYWSPEREMLKAELYTKFSSTKRTNFIKMSQSAMKIITKSLDNLVNRNEAPTTREAKDAVTILESLDKITRLDDGSPTEITGEKVMEYKDIKAIANLIPFKTKDKEAIVYVESEIIEKEDEDEANEETN